MPVSIAYFLVVLIWATTPLGIVWSSQSIDPSMALLLRSVIGLTLGLLLMKLLGLKFDWRPNALKIYLYSSISLFWGMSLGYFASRYITSGLMALCFGLAPIVSGVLAQRLLAETKFSNIKKFALVIALSGLAIVCWQNVAVKSNMITGLGLVLISVFLFSYSSVLVKGVPIQLHPLTSTMGTLLVCLPLFLLSWCLFAEPLNFNNWSSKSIGSVIYLGIMGSLVGFWAYFYILQKLAASTVGLVTMMTPALSMTLGIWVNNEPYSHSLLVGGSLITLGLALFQFGYKIKFRNK